MVILGVSFVVFMILLALFKIAPSMESSKSNNNGNKHQGIKKNRYNNKYFDNQLYTSKINYLIDNLLNYAIKEDVFYLQSKRHNNEILVMTKNQREYQFYTMSIDPIQKSLKVSWFYNKKECVTDYLLINSISYDGIDGWIENFKNIENMCMPDHLDW